MKSKLIIAAAAIMLLAVSGAVFAQELKFDGYLNSGLGVVVNDKDGEDAYLKAFGVDGESNGYRFRLNGSYTNEAKTAGVKFRLQSQRNLTTTTSVRVNSSGDVKDPDGDVIGTATTSGSANIANSYGYFSMPYAYGWVSFLNNIFTITGGIVDDGTWTTADWWWNDDQGEGLGLLLKAEPIKGLLLGVGAYTISQQSGGNNNILNFGGSLPNFRDVKLNLEDAKYTFNAAYTMPDVFRLGASYRLENKAAWPSTTPADDYAYSGREEASQLIGEFRFLGLKDLTAVVIGILDTFDDFSEKGNITLSETFAYKLDSLNIGLNAVQFLYNAKTSGKDTDPGLLFNLWGSYAFGNIVPRLDLVYFMGGRSKMVMSDTQWERRGFAPTKGAQGADDDLSVFSVRPSVRFNVDGRTFVEIGDIVNYDFGNYDGAYRDSGNAGKKSLLTNVFYVDIKFSF